MSITIGDGTFNEDDVLGVVVVVEAFVDILGPNANPVVSQTYPYVVVGVMTKSGGFRWAGQTHGECDGLLKAEGAALALDATLRSAGFVGLLRRDHAALIERKQARRGLAAFADTFVEVVAGREEVSVLRGVWGRPGTAASVVGNEHGFSVEFPTHGNLGRKGGGDGEVLRGSWDEIRSLVP